jgi:lysophospholipase L1-like esterase
MPARLRRVWARALPVAALVAASVLVTALVLEAVFRVAGVSVGTLQINRATIRRSADAGLLFELRPGASIQAEVGYRINHLGLRGPEIAEEKPAGATRLAVVGDSIAFGYWVEERDAFPRQLEGLLGGPARVQVLDFGVPGYGLEQYLETVRSRVLPLHPDVVVVSFCLNDLEGPMSFEYGLVMDRAARARSLPGRLYEAALAHSRLLAWIEYRLEGLEARRIFVRARDRGALYGPAPEEQLPLLRSRFTALESLLRPTGIPGLVAVFPLLGRPFDRYPHRALGEAVVRAARESGLEAVDLLDCFSAYDFRDVRVDVIHPSPLGHRVAAHAIRDALCSRGLACADAPALRGSCRDYRPEDFPKVRGY